MQIAQIEISHDAPLALIAGLNVLEAEADAITCAETLVRLGKQHDIPVVFKASFDKANRTRVDAYRGPGLDAGLDMLAAVKRATGLPLLTDVHEPGQAERVAGIVDCLQIPAFLCRQTDLLAACGATGLPVNLKKGQFVAAPDLHHAVDKLRHFGASDVLVTERGTSFGYNDLIVDMRSLIEIRRYAPVCFDATHAVQFPGRSDGASGGDRRFVAPLARAAVAVGIDALFIEIHPDPDRAPVDGPSQIVPDALDTLLGEIGGISRALGQA
jgi:2-dehydro-3-deoxyphosphooctonate aldolase (KDO 8-P synthase)